MFSPAYKSVMQLLIFFYLYLFFFQIKQRSESITSTMVTGPVISVHLFENNKYKIFYTINNIKIKKKWKSIDLFCENKCNKQVSKFFVKCELSIKMSNMDIILTLVDSVSCKDHFSPCSYYTVYLIFLRFNINISGLHSWNPMSFLSIK